MNRLELWGGHECTLNRVGERFSDQSILSGHDRRPEDLALFADLGIRRLRYPALWERTEVSKGVVEFGWLSDRLSRIQALGMEPILGLLHHGSGPAWTDLLDDDFTEAFGRYAGAIAARFPWARSYTPINEPLTTARFSCLYGHWYPHQRDERSMWRALLNQIDATRLAMRAIRAVNSDAELIQTEDLGRCQSTVRLAYQAEFENHRRWLTWDLLAGRVTSDHPLHAHLCGFGFADRLARIADDPCPADIIGVNHYPTSERFLDDRIDRYPPEAIGGNDRCRYADVEAVRVSQAGVDGFEPLLAEAWLRYGRPVAITECHIGCTREEQLRWLAEAWAGAQRLRIEGCEIVAVTAWSLLGAYDWDSLLTREDQHYESGVFDLRGHGPRPTALASQIKQLVAGGEPHPLATTPGWWRRDVRHTLGPVVRPAQPMGSAGRSASVMDGRQPLLITGATGTLGQAFAKACLLRGLPFYLTNRAELQIDDPSSVERAIERLQPWAVVNAAGWVRVDDAESAEAECFAANVDGAACLARRCAQADIALVTFSSDLVFGGSQTRAHVEGDEPGPLNVYGRSKLAAEAAATLAGGRCLIVRTAAFFQEADLHNFAAQVMRSLAAHQRVQAPIDLTVSPTYVPDLVRATLDLLIDGETGIWHLANEGSVSWFEFARRIATSGGFDPALVEGRPSAAFGWAAPRPAQVALASHRGNLLPPLDHAIGCFIRGYRQANRDVQLAAAS